MMFVRYLCRRHLLNGCLRKTLALSRDGTLDLELNMTLAAFVWPTADHYVDDDCLMACCCCCCYCGASHYYLHEWCDVFLLTLVIEQITGKKQLILGVIIIFFQILMEPVDFFLFIYYFFELQLLMNFSFLFSINKKKIFKNFPIFLSNGLCEIANGMCHKTYVPEKCWQRDKIQSGVVAKNFFLLKFPMKK